MGRRRRYFVPLAAWMVGASVLLGVAAAGAGGADVTLVTKEESLGKVPVEQHKRVSPDRKHVAYLEVRGQKWVVVVDGAEGKEYEGTASWLETEEPPVFTSPRSLYALMVRDSEALRVEIEIVQKQP